MTIDLNTDAALDTVVSSIYENGGYIVLDISKLNDDDLSKIKLNNYFHLTFVSMNDSKSFKFLALDLKDNLMLSFTFITNYFLN